MDSGVIANGLEEEAPSEVVEEHSHFQVLFKLQ